MNEIYLNFVSTQSHSMYIVLFLKK